MLEHTKSHVTRRNGTNPLCKSFQEGQRIIDVIVVRGTLLIWEAFECGKRWIDGWQDKASVACAPFGMSF